MQSATKGAQRTATTGPAPQALVSCAPALHTRQQRVPHSTPCSYHQLECHGHHLLQRLQHPALRQQLGDELGVGELLCQLLGLWCQVGQRAGEELIN